MIDDINFVEVRWSGNNTFFHRRLEESVTNSALKSESANQI